MSGKDTHQMSEQRDMEKLIVEGGCLCGKVRYRAAGPPRGITICHCVTCRRASGAPLVAWSGFAADRLTFTRGEPAIYRSSPGVERGFCGQCGTQLTYRRQDAADTIDVTIASLDDPEAIAPEDHTWVQNRLSWIVLGDRLPTYSANADRSTIKIRGEVA
jgi:hypothetical protein